MLFSVIQLVGLMCKSHEDTQCFQMLCILPFTNAFYILKELLFIHNYLCKFVNIKMKYFHDIKRAVLLLSNISMTL